MTSRFWRAGGNALRPDCNFLTAAAAAWAPASPSTPLVSYYDPSDISTLWKDTAGTVPVTADGDIVRRIDDKSGNGRHATQPFGSGFGPIYRTGGGKPFLAVTVAGQQWLEASAAQFVNATTGTHSCGAAFIFTNTTGVQHVIGTDGAVGHAQFLRNDAGTAKTTTFTSATSFVDSGPTITAATATTLIEVFDGTNIEIFVNNSGNGSTAVNSGTPTTGTQPVGLCGVTGNNGDCEGKYYGSVHYSGALSSGDRGSLHTWLAAKM